MRLGALCVTFITVFTQCNCASLEVLIDGDVRESPASCVGENITFVCTVASLRHSWTVGSFVSGQTVLARDDEDITEVGVFTFRRVNVSGGTITSSVSVLSFSDLNNVMIECVDGGGGTEEQNNVAQVYGASVPSLTVMSTLPSFVLTPQVTNPECVIITDITITPASTDGVMREDIPVSLEDLGVAILVDGYDVCLYTYNFTIVATTPGGELRTTVSQDGVIDLSGANPITGLSGTSDGLVWSAPANAMECSFQYMITLDANPDISLTVDTNRVSFTNLNVAGFLPTCVRQNITVTPVVPINNQILDGSSATESLITIAGINPSISVTVDKLDVTFMWSTEAGELDSVTIGRDSESMVTVDYAEGEYTVSLNCSYVGQSVTFNGMFISDDCIYDAFIAPAEIIVLGDNCDSTSRGESGGGSSSVVLITVVSVVLFIVNHVGVVAGFAAHHPHPLLHSMRK